MRSRINLPYKLGLANNPDDLKKYAAITQAAPLKQAPIKCYHYRGE
jgi:hypothetical protein